MHEPKHTQHKLKGRQRRSTAYSDEW